MKPLKFHIVIYLLLFYSSVEAAIDNSSSVKWLDFKIKSERFNAVLSWSTSQEINNETFIIERSDDGITFFPIGNVPGAINSKNINYYSFNDIHTSTGISYYRLRQVDTDKLFSYSEILTFNTDKTIQLYVTPYPNNGEFDVNIISPGNNLQLYITNVLSKQIYQYTISNNSSIFNTVHIRLNESPPGLYLVYLSSDTDYKITTLRIE